MIEEEYLQAKQGCEMVSECLDSKDLTFVVSAPDHGDALLKAVIVHLVLTLAGDEAVKAFGEGGMDIVTGSATDNADACDSIRAERKDNGIGKPKQC